MYTLCVRYFSSGFKLSFNFGYSVTPRTSPHPIPEYDSLAKFLRDNLGALSVNLSLLLSNIATYISVLCVAMDTISNTCEVRHRV